jgi:hypothetical protein
MKYCAIVTLIILFSSSVIYAALPAGAIGGWSGTVNFNQTAPDGRDMTGHIDYAVYDVSVTQPFAPLPTGDYIYTYQIYNSVSSDVWIDYLSVAILDNVEVLEIGTSNLLAGVDSSFEYFSPSTENAMSANYLFIPSINGLIAPMENSVILYFTSNYGPTMGFGSVAGGAVSENVLDLPTPLPVPEPATVLFMLLGGLVTFRKIRKAV